LKASKAAIPAASILSGRIIAAPLCALAFAPLAACGNDAGEAAGGVSTGEAEALEQAAEMLESERLPEGVMPSAGEGPPPPDTEAQAETQSETGPQTGS